jgi:hypothetical protein
MARRRTSRVVSINYGRYPAPKTRNQQGYGLSLFQWA